MASAAQVHSFEHIAGPVELARLRVVEFSGSPSASEKDSAIGEHDGGFFVVSGAREIGAGEGSFVWIVQLRTARTSPAGTNFCLTFMISPRAFRFAGRNEHSMLSRTRVHAAGRNRCFGYPRALVKASGCYKQ
jgi:hypothetical protein